VLYSHFVSANNKNELIAVEKLYQKIKFADIGESSVAHGCKRYFYQNIVDSHFSIQYLNMLSIMIFKFNCDAMIIRKDNSF
jgi:hypothetical protein